MRPHRTTILVPVLWVLVLAWGAPGRSAAQAPTARTLWRNALQIDVFNEAVCGDFDLDGENEILISGSSGDVYLVKASTGRVLWHTVLDGTPTLSPVVGQFVNPSPVEAAFLHQDGRVHVLAAASGEVLLNVRLPEPPNLTGPAFTLAPSLLPALTPSDLDSLVAVREDRRLVNICRDEKGSIQDRWSGRPIGDPKEMSIQPPAVMRFAGPRLGLGVYGVVFVSNGQNIVFADTRFPDEAPKVYTPANYERLISSTAAVWEDADGLARKVLWSDPQRQFVVARIDASEDAPSLKPLSLFLRYPVDCLQQASTSPALLDANGDGALDVILNSSTQIMVLDGRLLRGQSAPGGRIDALPGFTKYAAIEDLATPCAPFATSEEEPFVAIGDARDTLHLINLRRHGEAGHAFSAKVGPLGFTSPLVLDADKDGRIDVFVQHLDRSVTMVATSLLVESGTVLWPTRGGSCMHGGGRPSIYESEKAEERQSQKIILNRRLEDAARVYEEGDADQALEMAAFVLKFNPRNRDALDIEKDAEARLHRFSRLITRAVVLVVAIVVLYILWRAWATFSLIRRTREMAGRGEKELLLDAFERHMRLHKGMQMRVIAHLARICQQVRVVPAGMTATFERAHRVRPSTLDVALTLADLYLEENRLDPDVVPVFEMARKESTSPAPFNLALGRIHYRQGNARVARRYLEESYKQGNRSGDLFEALARVYIDLDQLTVRHLPVFELVARQRPDDAAIVEALAKSYVRAGMQQDPKAQDAFRRLSRLKPDSPVANQEIAAAAFREGDPERAVDAARKTLSVEPENPTALLVCAWCLWQQGDMGAESRGIYLKAFGHHPGDSLLLRIVAQMDLEKPGIDDETAARIAQAVETNLNDSRFLSSVAAAASNWERTGLARKALESLAATRSLCEEEVLALARIYVTAGEKTPGARDVLIRAYGLDPDMPGLPPLLGDILVEEKRYDVVFADLFERLTAADPSSVAWGLHLAKIYMSQERFEAVARVLDPLHEQAPGDSEIQRLLAEAHSNLKEFSKAVDHYKEVLAANPNDNQALAGLAHNYALMDDRSEEMCEIISRARVNAPDDPLLAFAAGEHALAFMKWAEAASCFHQVIGASPERADAILDRIVSTVKSLKGRDSMPARWLHVQVLLFLKRFDEILAVTEEIYELDSLENQRILAVYDRILKDEPSHTTALLGRAYMLKRQGNNAEARTALETILAADPEHDGARRLLARVYGDLLSHEESAGLRFALGRILMKIEDYDAAVGCFQKTRQESSLEKQSTRYLAECFFLKRMYDLSLQEFQNVAVDAETKPILYNLGKQFETLNNPAAAKTAYQRIYAVDAAYLDVADRINHLTHTSGIQLTGETQPLGIDRTRTLLVDPSGARHRYDLLEEIGRGAMSTVYRAHDNELDEIVALKILPENLLTNPEALRRFRLEARSARRLAHDHIVRIHDIGEEQERKYISMEYVPGGTLRQVIHAHDLQVTFDTILKFARQIAEAMSYAHRSGLIHRDLKPANIMLTEQGDVKVTDFGISKAITQDDQTKTGTSVGTPLYMSPEQVRGEPCDRRADIYSYGVLLYELISGTPPFNQGDLSYQHLHVEAPPLENVHPVLGEIVMKCLRKSAEERWSGFDEIIEMLGKISEAQSEEKA
ncbi:protein kinase [Candidatus Sumerlaeota bacterium]|nr:protein kinase [Candidatus Sumerlaeota bacterium]